MEEREGHGRRRDGLAVSAGKINWFKPFRTLIRGAAGNRLETIHWNCMLGPGIPWRLRFPVPIGDVLGVTVALTPPAPRHDKHEGCLNASRV